MVDNVDVLLLYLYCCLFSELSLIIIIAFAISCCWPGLDISYYPELCTFQKCNLLNLFSLLMNPNCRDMLHHDIFHNCIDAISRKHYQEDE